MGVPRRFRDVAVSAYSSAGVGFCCDPRDLAEGLGLQVRPANVARASIERGVLRFPNRAKLSDRGLGIYFALAAFLLGDEADPEDVRGLALELIMPTPVACMGSIVDLVRLQPHVPLGTLIELVATARGSWSMTKIAG
jgi:hypothetical protein